jgi:hypothetical protein
MVLRGVKGLILERLGSSWDPAVFITPGKRIEERSKRKNG